MGCPEFEELSSAEGRDHAAHCAECRALLDALLQVDATFDAAFAGISAPPGLPAAVRARAARASLERRPSPLPEVLDLIGWAAVLATAVIVIPRFATLLNSILSELR